jgi:hypothetical protein
MDQRPPLPLLRAAALLPLALVLVLAAGCSTPPIRADLPDSFLELERSPHEFKAVAADNSILWVERFEPPGTGQNLAFWIESLRQDLVTNRGYTLLAESPIQSRDGIPGHEMTLEAFTKGRPYRYLIAVFVAGSKNSPIVYAARFTAEKEAFDGHEEEVRSVLRSLDF